MILLSGSDMTLAIAREHASEQIGLTTKMASHTLRKTLKRSYPIMIREKFSFFGYYLTIQPLDYIGITGEEIKEACMKLNHNSSKQYPMDSIITESSTHFSSLGS